MYCSQHGGTTGRADGRQACEQVGDTVILQCASGSACGQTCWRRRRAKCEARGMRTAGAKRRSAIEGKDSGQVYQALRWAGRWSAMAGGGVGCALVDSCEVWDFQIVTNRAGVCRAMTVPLRYLAICLLRCLFYALRYLFTDFAVCLRTSRL